MSRRSRGRPGILVAAVRGQLHPQHEQDADRHADAPGSGRARRVPSLRAALPAAGPRTRRSRGHRPGDQPRVGDAEVVLGDDHRQQRRRSWCRRRSPPTPSRNIAASTMAMSTSPVTTVATSTAQHRDAARSATAISTRRSTRSATTPASRPKTSHGQVLQRPGQRRPAAGRGLRGDQQRAGGDGDAVADVADPGASRRSQRNDGAESHAADVPQAATGTGPVRDGSAIGGHDADSSVGGLRSRSAGVVGLGARELSRGDRLVHRLGGERGKRVVLLLQDVSTYVLEGLPTPLTQDNGSPLRVGGPPVGRLRLRSRAGPWP